LSEKKKIAILGAGLSGLACACRLSDIADYDITIIDKESRVGGLATSIHYKGHTSDLGPHRIHSEIKRVLDFLEREAGTELITCPRASRMFLDNKFITYPPGLGDTLFHFGPIRLAGFMGSFIGSRISATIHPPEEENFETVMIKAFGRGLYRAVIKPYTEKTWKRKASELSKEVAGARVSAGGLGALARRIFLGEKKGKETSLKKFLYIRGGIENLCIELKEKLEKKGVNFVLNSDISKLAKSEDSKWNIHYKQNEKSGNKKYDFCFSTIPLPDLINILPDEKKNSELNKSAGSLSFLSMMLVFVRIKKKSLSNDTWLYFPGNTIFNRAYESRNFDKSLVPDGETMLCLEITYPLEERDEWKKRHDEMKEEALEDLISTGLVKKDDIIDCCTTKISHAYPIYDINYRKSIDRIQEFLKKFPKLISLGRQGLFHHNNMDHSIYEGLLAADYYMDKENACAEWYNDTGQFRNLRIVD
jgi:protoporphyrinogen oxidase